MFRKGAIKICRPLSTQFLSNLFLVAKNDGGHRPVINLKELNKNIPYQHFKMEGLHYLKLMLQQGDYMFKLEMKDAYFSVPLNKISREKVRFQWSGKLYEFIWLCFGLSPAHRIFTKILKVPIKAIEHSNNHISGRHVITGENNGGDFSSQRHTNFSVATSGVCNKSKEISTRTTTKNGISGLNNRFSEPFVVTNRTKTAESKKLLCGDV